MMGWKFNDFSMEEVLWVEILMTFWYYQYFILIVDLLYIFLLFLNN